MSTAALRGQPLTRQPDPPAWVAREQSLSTALTATADSGAATVATVAGERILLRSAELKAGAAITADLTHAVVTAGPAGQPLTLIDEVAGAQGNFDAEGSSAVWTGAQVLELGDEVVVTLTGTGATAVDFAVWCRYEPLVEGGTLT